MGSLFLLVLRWRIIITKDVSSRPNSKKPILQTEWEISGRLFLGSLKCFANAELRNSQFTNAKRPTEIKWKEKFDIFSVLSTSSIAGSSVFFGAFPYPETNWKWLQAERNFVKFKLHGVKSGIIF